MNLITRCSAVLLACLGLSLPGAAQAQTAIPGNLLPGQLEKQFQAEPRARGQAGGVVPALREQAVPEGAEGVRFTAKDIQLEGATVYSQDTLRATLAPYIGKEMSLRDLYGLANTLTARYRNDGYFLSQVVVPAQAIESGRVKLRAVEGYVSEVSYAADPPAPKSPRIDAYARKIAATRPLTSQALERYLLLMNDLPGVHARAILAPAKQAPGAAELILQVSEKRWSAGASVDNRGGKILGDWRMILDGEAANWLGRHENTSLKYVGSPSKALRYLALQHEEQIGTEGGKLHVSLGGARTEPEDRTFVPLNLETSSETFGLAYSHPVLRSRSENLTLRGSLNGHRGKENVFGITDRTDKLRPVRLGLTYDRTDAFRGTNLVDVELSHGLSGLGASKNGDPLLTRAGGKVDFTKLNVFAARVQTLSEHWSLLAALSGQYAFDDLLASELYGFGGDLFGRGYDASELVGDHGAALKLELRNEGVIRRFSSPVAYRVYAYYDVGRVWQRSPQGGDSSDTGASAGLGVRFHFDRGVSLTFELAKPLTRDVAAEGDKSLRGFIGLSARF